MIPSRSVLGIPSKKIYIYIFPSPTRNDQSAKEYCPHNYFNQQFTILKRGREEHFKTCPITHSRAIKDKQPSERVTLES